MSVSPRESGWRIVLAVAGCFCLVVAVPSRAEGPKPKPVDYNEQVRPILSRNCFPCHGQDDGHRSAGLRLDIRAEATKPLEDGATAIVPSDPDASELVFRITETDESVHMPPKKTGNLLQPDEVALLTRWIQEGAPYTEHWSLIPPEHKPLPEIQHRAWPRNGIDHFVVKRLEDAKLEPAPEADKFVLLRRVSLDLRGLPPTPREVAEFARDTSPNAYENAVDRFLDDPAYGERWARMWLDLARYADSAGYGSDPLRLDMWRYRDWVIDAFNRNLPFDQFTTEQIAGDLLENPTLDQKLATAFHRNTMTNTEGGTDDEEWRVAAIKDRVDSTMQVWMGLTMGCAKCHTHKYDPITQEEYYRFFAIFNQTADADLPDESPTLPAPTPDMIAKNRAIDAEIAKLKPALDQTTPELAAAQKRWEDSLAQRGGWTILEPVATSSEHGARLDVQSDHSVLVSGMNPDHDTTRITARTDLKGISAFRLEVLPDPTLPGAGAGRGAYGRFVLSRVVVDAQPIPGETGQPIGRYVRFELPGDQKMLSLAEVQVFHGAENIAPRGAASQSSTAHEGPARLAIDGETNGRFFEARSTTHTRAERDPWWEVKLDAATPIDRLVVWNRTDGDVGGRLAGVRVSILDDARRTVWQASIAEAPRPSRELVPGGRQTVALAQAEADFTTKGFNAAELVKPDAKGLKGWSVGQNETRPHALVLVVADQPLGIAPVELSFRLEQGANDTGANLGRFRLSATNDPAATRRLGVPEPILAILDTAADHRAAEQSETLARHYRSIAPELKPTRDAIARLEKSRPAIPNLPVMVELTGAKKRETHLLRKGNFLDPGEVVEPGVPAALHDLPANAPVSRMSLAAWLVDPRNPLTARVTVNRFWSQLFGVGLVETEEDFGTQGDLPTHPELLDWLALEYERLGWDTKALLRLIVTSSTYRQSSKTTPERLEVDPRNRLLSHAPRFRLEAEMVRDQALALSGLMSQKIGGPSVFPPQPEGLWQAAFNGQRTWSSSAGEDRYRRGLYTFWRRTVPYPSMATFDAPSRETCTIKRSRTNNPLQAFVTLNDPVFVECAQALGRRIVREGGTTVEERIRFGLRLCLGRPAADEQVGPLRTLYQAELERYRTDPESARALATEPIGPLPEGLDAAEAAAWTTIANVLLNLDGVLTKG